MKVTIKHYGAFRQFGADTCLDVASPVTVAAVRQQMVVHLGQAYQWLVEDSALANNSDILPDEYVIGEACTLSILPPVCGG